ncbi:ribokinase [Alphaproteobacteria bacterium KMM 3653]|uniref:Ribokinase n=1 Tax=Harenicola maris TaxID=2841044 RepID=A0AAP2G493_9RHOB|nr:ribokinase [Harenicola maris]
MTIYCLGSINIDHVYQVPEFPAPGETLTCKAYAFGIGGKGANQSVAAARAGARVVHIGAYGAGGEWARDVLADAGVDCAHVAMVDAPTGHAVITVDAGGENIIVLAPGANRAIGAAQVEAALGAAGPGDWFLTQNETNLCVEAAQMAKAKGLQVCYSAAPFEAEAVRAMLPLSDLIVVNEGEYAQCRAAMPEFDAEMQGRALIVTLGAKGARYIGPQGDVTVPARKVTPVDTTGAGDTFLGYALAELDAGAAPEAALALASGAAAIQVTRQGAIEAIPLRAEVAAS